MPAVNTPICEFGWQAKNFSLPSTDNEIIELKKARGRNGTLVMFICNHCPYVVSTLDEIIFEANELIKNEIEVIAISSNDVSTHPEDSFENMKQLSMDKKLPLEERFKAQQKLSKLPRNSAKIRVMNRCQITGRPHGVYRKLKISRIALRQLGLQGKIPGIVKSSW